MASAKDRRAPRVHVALDVFLQTVDGDVSFKTSDASYEGVFLLSSNPLPLRKLIRFRTRLPESGEELQMLGLIAHTVNATDAAETGTTAGMGIQLFSLGRETRERWRDYVDELYESNPEARRAVEVARRPKVKIRIPNAGILKRFREVDLPAGSLFLRTPELHPQGTEVDCIIVHPITDEKFAIPGQVLKSIDGTVKERGMRLSFTVPDDTTELDAFLNGDVPTSEDENEEQ